MSNVQAHTVASHYNARPNGGTAVRQYSSIFNMKACNNWIKSVLFAKFCPKGAAAFDMACGKGGDLKKWEKAEIRDLFAADIAAVSIDHARMRFSEYSYKFGARFVAMDCFETKISTVVPSNHLFDFVSIQFALHYSFESEQKARTALINASSNLRKGGYFCGTIPDADRIIKNVRGPKKRLEFGNSIYKIKFEQVDHTYEFGHKYTFDLMDAIDSCPEYVININVLRRLAKDYGLELVYKKGFHELFYEEIRNPEFRQRLHRMKVLNKKNTISNEEWEAIGLYTAFAFKKMF